MKRYCLFFAVIVVFIPFVANSQKLEHPSSDFKPMKPNGQPMATLMNINNISMWIRADGLSGAHPKRDTVETKLDRQNVERSSGIFFPRGTAGVINHDGIVWGGEVRDGQSPIRRVGGSTFRSGMLPGSIISKGEAEDPNEPDVRIWRIRPDWQTADLTRDAAEFFDLPEDSVTREQIEAVRSQYEKDWNEWPWQKGAPFYDDNENGMMDPGEEPGLANADQVVWFVANDLAETATFGLYGSPPIGIEFQGTLWAYKEREFQGSKILGNTIFKRYRLIYKGTNTTPQSARIDSMFMTHWANPDIGEPDNDFAGCDTTLDLAYTYNGTIQDQEFENFDLAPPAVGYTLLQGPLVSANHEEGQFDFQSRQGVRNLDMTSFSVFYLESVTPAYFRSMPPFEQYESTEIWYLFMNGSYFLKEAVFCDPIPCPDTIQVHYPFTGDPVTGSGDLERIIRPPGERMIGLNTGPFTIALGDTQEVIIALVGGLGADNLFSVQVMKHHAKWARQLAEVNFELPPESEPEPEEPPLPNRFRLSQNFPNPFNPGTEIRFELPVERHVNLTIYNVLGQNIKTLVDEVKAAGSHSVTWDGTDDNGQPVPSGVYFYRFDAGIVSGTKKMILMR
ncbi:T9SS type A sorting domain-containing protein [candidate division KSB1 bacterium]|nr:T9SS type A sorting domain-containing protein [candidate division KSB1 bacterium]